MTNKMPENNEEPIEEPIEEEPIVEEESEPFEDIKRFGLLKVLKLYVTSIYDDATKVLVGLLTNAQKTDLTDGGATTLHKHDLYIAKDGTTTDVSADISLNTHYLQNVIDPANNQDAATKKYVDDNSINNVVEDTTPQLGGDLDLNSHNIDFPTTANISDCKDEDDMATDSAVMLATQQSIKKYVDDNKTDYSAGDSLLKSADTERSKSDDTSYTKVKEIVINRNGALRIKFDLSVSLPGGYIAYGRIYKNGVAVGTEQSTTTAYPSYENFSEDIAGWSTGDLVQLYYKTQTDRDTYVRNFRIYVLESLVVNTD